MKKIPYARQDVSDADLQAVLDVLRSDFLTQGPTVGRFEQAVADYCGARHAVAVTNATSGLHLACLALGLGEGDRLWTSPNTFVASANCGLYCGAEVDFVDIDPRSYNMSVSALEAKLATAEEAGRLPKIVIPVHFAGQSCDMAAIAKLAGRYGFKIVEDASHAIGGSYKGEKVGCGRYSDAVVFSFHPVKIITTGEGGLVATNSAELHERLARLHTHGITRDPKRMSHAADGPWYYEQIDLGYNYRMTDLQAALGLSQLARIDGFVKRRHELARRYDEALRGLPIALPWSDPDAHSAFHLYVVRLDADRARKSHRQVFEALHERGILVNLHYIPVHIQPYYRKLGFSPGQFPEAEKHYAEAISLPMYPALSDADQDRVIAALREVLA